jgi:hypothetical protein
LFSFWRAAIHPCFGWFGVEHGGGFAPPLLLLSLLLGLIWSAAVLLRRFCFCLALPLPSAPNRRNKSGEAKHRRTPHQTAPISILPGVFAMSEVIRNRIKAHRRVRAGELVPHEWNYRSHPEAQ